MCSQASREGAVGYWLGRWFCVTVEFSVTTAVTITASYWLLLGGDDEYQYKFMNVHEHVMNTVLALTSFLFVKRAFTWWHIIFMWIFGVFYGLQNYLSYLGMPSRNNIYGLINWEDLHQELDSNSRTPLWLIDMNHILWIIKNDSAEIQSEKVRGKVHGYPGSDVNNHFWRSHSFLLSCPFNR